MRTFVFTEAKSNKFWNIELSGKTFTVTFGRVGTNGQSQMKGFADAATAKKEHDKLVAEKLKKGYVETTASTPAPAKPAKPEPSTEQKALEAALVAHPDEATAHAVYGDYLVEAGDPRGELVQVQLALEDETRPKADRDALRKREKALLKKHAGEWMGEAGRFLVGEWSGKDKPYHGAFARGWLDTVRTLPVPEMLIEAVAKSPEARMLRRLEVIYDMRYHPFDFDQFIEKLNGVLTEDEQLDEEGFYMSDPGTLLPPLAGSPYLTNLRVLKYGFSDDHPRGPSHSTMVSPFGSKAAELLDVLKNCPRLEELYLNTDLRPIDTVFSSKLLGNLRVFQYYYGTNYSDYRSRANPYPLSVLAQNKALKNLATLRLHPGRETTIDIDEFDALVRSKNLPALAHLQVHMTTFGDEGADRLVSSGILKRLKTLDIGYGNMTDDGARVLAACPDLKNLEVLDVSKNALTRAGISALKGAGVRIVADDQHSNDEGDDTYNEYLYSVDWE
ncbi:MAG: WGR domain-containing protein [Planctomycetes bacterium]|nr:WGR domain-containing protein [Planctomycetota bacterium]